MNIRTLVVEDDFDLAETIVLFLELEGMSCDHGANGRSGLNLIRANAYDVLVLDLNLPRISGIELCRTLREEGRDLPVLMLTAKDTLGDKLAGFAAGTDDYLVKPFEMAELTARIRALAGRRSSRARQLAAGDLFMDLKQHRAFRAGQPLDLTPIEWRLLETLVRASPELVSRRDLEYAVWGEEPPESDSLKVHLHKLRQRVDRDFPCNIIRTLPGRGVVLAVSEGGPDEAAP